MRSFVNFTKRFISISVATFGLSSLANFQHHQSYWEGTIKRVQTVDFNILSHTLPTKLSHALIDRNFNEIQRTLDSNYGFFGLVVTDCLQAQADCPNQRLISITNSEYAWREQLDENMLAQSSYDILRNPPPILTEGKHDDARDSVRNSTGFSNEGDIIGRVYYVRGIPPNFIADYFEWIRKWPHSIMSDRGALSSRRVTARMFA